MIRLWISIVPIALLMGCTAGEPPPLEVSDVSVYAPLPGSRVSVAYMTVTNNSSNDVTFVRFTSDIFDDVELHETTITDGVARMRSLQTLSVPATASVELREGGKHLMLMESNVELALGMTVTLTLSTVDSSIVISAPLEARLQVD